jgi:hypothetical protein
MRTGAGKHKARRGERQALWTRVRSAAAIAVCVHQRKLPILGTGAHSMALATVDSRALTTGIGLRGVLHAPGRRRTALRNWRRPKRIDRTRHQLLDLGFCPFVVVDQRGAPLIAGLLHDWCVAAVRRRFRLDGQPQINDTCRAILGQTGVREAYRQKIAAARRGRRLRR